MKISDLEAFLASVKAEHGDLDILERRYSDYRLMEIEQPNWEKTWDVVTAAPQGDDWIMRDHESLTDEQRTSMHFKKYLYFDGN